jgi:hypothetical protein
MHFMGTDIRAALRVAVLKARDMFEHDFVKIAHEQDVTYYA